MRRGPYSAAATGATEPSTLTPSLCTETWMGVLHSRFRPECQRWGAMDRAEIRMENRQGKVNTATYPLTSKKTIGKEKRIYEASRKEVLRAKGCVQG